MVGALLHVHLPPDPIYRHFAFYPLIREFGVISQIAEPRSVLWNYQVFLIHRYP